jgi:hypothetical protein
LVIAEVADSGASADSGRLSRIHRRRFAAGKGAAGKGVRTYLCEAPFGPFRQISPDPFSGPGLICAKHPSGRSGK